MILIPIEIKLYILSYVLSIQNINEYIHYNNILNLNFDKNFIKYLYRLCNNELNIIINNNIHHNFKHMYKNLFYVSKNKVMENLILYNRVFMLDILLKDNFFTQDIIVKFLHKAISNRRKNLVNILLCKIPKIYYNTFLSKLIEFNMFENVYNLSINFNIRELSTDKVSLEMLEFLIALEYKIPNNVIFKFIEKNYTDHINLLLEKKKIKNILLLSKYSIKCNNYNICNILFNT